MEKVAKKVELVANILIIIVAIAIVVVLVKRFMLAPAQPAPSFNNVAIGSQVSLPGVDWASNRRTLILVLSSTCRFCTESADFYKKLANERKAPNDYKLLALFHQPTDVAQKYLNSLGVSVDEIREGSLSPMGVRSTPTLLLVDSSGIVKGSWIGKLPPEKENEVLKSLL